MYLFKILLDISMFGFLSEECSIKLKQTKWSGLAVYADFVLSLGASEPKQ